MSDIRAEVHIDRMMGGVVADIIKGMTRGRNKAGERLLALSNIEAPMDTGDMIANHSSVVPATSAEEDVLVVYDAPQAARLHEHPEYNFQNGRKGKYLEDPAVQNLNELAQIVAREATRRG